MEIPRKARTVPAHHRCAPCHSPGCDQQELRWAGTPSQQLSPVPQPQRTTLPLQPARRKGSPSYTPSLAVIAVQEQTLPGWEEREDHQVGVAPGICLLEPRRRRKLLPGTGSFTVATAARSYPTAEARLSPGQIVKGSASPYRQGLRTHGERFLGALLPWRR